MTEIERRVHLEAAPVAVAARLAASMWRGALSIEPEGAGTRVDIRARVEPEALARSIEAAALDEVCALKRSLLPATNRTQATNQPSTNTVKSTGKQPLNWRRTTMTIIERSVTINAEADRVWPALADFGGISAWNPSVKASRLTSPRGAGEGTTRECQLTPLGTVQERVTEWVEGRMMTIEITEFKNVPAMRSAVAVLELEPQGDSSIVHMQMNYEVGLGAIGAGMNSMVMKRQYVRAISGLLAGLKHHVETGQPIGGTGDIPKQALAAVSS